VLNHKLHNPVATHFMEDCVSASKSCSPASFVVREQSEIQMATTLSVPCLLKSGNHEQGWPPVLSCLAVYASVLAPQVAPIVQEGECAVHGDGDGGA
jgi:hypothetical protein